MKVDKEIKRRDKTIRSYILSRTWDKNPEFLLIRKVVQDLTKKKPELSKFKFVYDYEWEVESGLSNKGKGDLIFTDGNNGFLIVECKNKNPQEVRQQTLKYMKLFEEIQRDIELIIGVAVYKEGWDLFSHGSSYWDIDISEKERTYYELFNDLKNPDEIRLRNKFQELYKDLGLIPNNPINTLKELEDKGFIEIIYKAPEKITSPFNCEVWVKSLKFFPKKNYYGKGAGLKKKEAKAIAFAEICNQLFLPYHMKDLHIPIREQQMKDLLFKKKLIKN